MLIAVSGSQGSGKSTVLQKLREMGFKTIDRKTSRSILADWDVTLEQVNNDRDLTLKFQDEIIARKATDEKVASESDELYFTERTFADLFTYALISLGKDNINAEWLNEYYSKCLGYQQNYDHVYYLTAGWFNVEADGTRASGKHYSRMADLIMRDYTTQMVLPSKLSIVNTPDLKERVDLISMQAYNMHKQNNKKNTGENLNVEALLRSSMSNG